MHVIHMPATVYKCPEFCDSRASSDLAAAVSSSAPTDSWRNIVMTGGWAEPEQALSSVSPLVDAPVKITTWWAIKIFIWEIEGVACNEAKNAGELRTLSKLWQTKILGNSNTIMTNYQMHNVPVDDIAPF